MRFTLCCQAGEANAHLLPGAPSALHGYVSACSEQGVLFASKQAAVLLRMGSFSQVRL